MGDASTNRKGRIVHLKTTTVILIVSFLACGPVYSDVVWSDEFNGDSIDPATWTYDIGGHGFGNGQLEYDTARRENSYIENGSLVIEARREDYFGNSFTSARMLTQGRFAFKYGSLEARIKVPDTADGLWAAFWMLGNNFPAIDWPMSDIATEVDLSEVSQLFQVLSITGSISNIEFDDICFTGGGEPRIPPGQGP